MERTTTPAEADRIVKSLQDRRIFSNDKIEDELRNRGDLDNNDNLRAILLSMAQKGNAFAWFIESKLLTVAGKDPDFVHLVSEIARGKLWPISKLFELYNKDPAVSEFLYDELDRAAKVELAWAMGFTLGGMGLAEPERLFDLVKSNPYPAVHEGIAFLVALRTSLQREVPDATANFVITSSRSENAQLRFEATLLMMTHLDASTRFEEGLRDLARQDGPETQEIATYLPTARRSGQIAVDLLQLCAKSKNSSTLAETVQAMGVFAADRPIECLDILRVWHQQGFRPGIGFDWVLGEIGKGNAKEVKEFLLNWVEEEKDPAVRALDLPHYVGQIYRDRLRDLPAFLVALDLKAELDQRIAMNILEQVLSDMFENLDRSEGFLKEFYAILADIVRLEGVDVNEAVRNIDDPVMQSLALIDSLKHKPKTPDLNLVQANLNHFPTLVRTLGPKWFAEQLEKPANHPLISILDNARVSVKEVETLAEQFKKETEPFRKMLIAEAIMNQYYPFAFLVDLDWALSVFERTEQGMKRIVRGLMNRDEFFQTISELQLAARLKTRFPVIMQFKVGDIPVDMKATIANQDCLLEVIGAESELKMKYIRSVLSLGNRAKDKIIEKADGQLKEVAAKSALPLILVIDRSRAPQISEADVEDALEGALGVRFILNKVKGEVIAAGPVRAKDSASDQSPNTRMLSGILLVRSDIDGGMLKVRLQGRYYHNPRGISRLGGDIVSSLEAAVNQ